MVELRFTHKFKKSLAKTDANTRERILKQIAKLKTRPEAGKPMRYVRKGTRELYVAPYRLSYCIEGAFLVLLEIYHKDEQ